MKRFEEIGYCNQREEDREDRECGAARFIWHRGLSCHAFMLSPRNLDTSRMRKNVAFQLDSI
jgi:hypothetical protein